MLLAATALIERNGRPSEDEVQDALGGVLCRCTGYRKIITAVCDAHRFAEAPADTPGNRIVGSRVARVDGIARLDGSERYGDDVAPSEALWLKVVRSPYPAATFTIGDLAPLHARYPGLVRVLTAADVPGHNSFGVIPGFRDQPVFAGEKVRFRGEAIAAVVGDAATIERFDPRDFPVTWQELPALTTIDAGAGRGCAAALRQPAGQPAGARLCPPRRRAGRAGAGGARRRGRLRDGVRRACLYRAGGGLRPPRWRQRRGSRDDADAVHGPRRGGCWSSACIRRTVRIVPTACGGGFGGKLDMSLQPFIALAAWLLDRPVRCLYDRAGIDGERPRSGIRRGCGCGSAPTADGRLAAMVFDGDFNTGAYASWGPTVANRVPVHCSGPVLLASDRGALARGADQPRCPPAPSAASARRRRRLRTEALLDELAEALRHDRLEFRIANALRPGQPTATGQVLEASAGMARLPGGAAAGMAAPAGAAVTGP